jgi:Domain of unknown function (DUF4440)
VIDRFVTAQNAHDLAAVGGLLWDSPQFLWITRGTAIWGRQPALTRFEALYRGTWRLEPALSDLRIIVLGDRVAQIYVPITFTIGAAGQETQKTRFLMNQVLLKDPAADAHRPDQPPVPVDLAVLPARRVPQVHCLAYRA